MNSVQKGNGFFKQLGRTARGNTRTQRSEVAGASRPTRTSEAADFDRVQRPSLQARFSRVHRALAFAQTAGELELVRGEDVADQVAQQPPAVFLRRVDSFVPLLVCDEERIVLQELFTALRGGDGG